MSKHTTESLSKYLDRKAMNDRIGCGEVDGYEAWINTGAGWERKLFGSYSGCVEVCNQYVNSTRITEVKF